MIKSFYIIPELTCLLYADVKSNKSDRFYQWEFYYVQIGTHCIQRHKLYAQLTSPVVGHLSKHDQYITPKTAVRQWCAV